MAYYIGESATCCPISAEKNKYPINGKPTRSNGYHRPTTETRMSGMNGCQVTSCNPISFRSFFLSKRFIWSITTHSPTTSTIISRSNTTCHHSYDTPRNTNGTNTRNEEIKRSPNPSTLKPKGTTSVLSGCTRTPSARSLYERRSQCQSKGLWADVSALHWHGNKSFRSGAGFR